MTDPLSSTSGGLEFHGKVDSSALHEVLLLAERDCVIERRHALNNAFNVIKRFSFRLKIDEFVVSQDDLNNANSITLGVIFLSLR